MLPTKSISLASDGGTTESVGSAFERIFLLDIFVDIVISLLYSLLCWRFVNSIPFHLSFKQQCSFESVTWLLDKSA